MFHATVSRYECFTDSANRMVYVVENRRCSLWCEIEIYTTYTNASLHTLKKNLIFLLDSNVLCIALLSFANFQYIKDNFRSGTLEEKYYTFIKTKLVYWLRINLTNHTHTLTGLECVYCLTQLYDGRDMYRIYYIKNNYMFRHLTSGIFRLRNEKT